MLADLPFLEEVPQFGPLGDHHIAIDIARPGNRPFPILLDTGAEGSVLTPRYARELGVSVRRTRDRPYRRDTLLRPLEFWIDGTSDTGARRFETGLLGGNFLQKYVVEVDYEARRVRFLDPKQRPVSEEDAEPGEVVVPMRLTNTGPSIEIELGDGSAWFLMDTGAPSDLYIAEEKAGKLGIGYAEGELLLGKNLYGDDRSSVVSLPSARVGGHEIPEVRLAVALRKGSSFRVTNVAGVDGALLGNDFMRRFRVRFDYQNRKVALLPVAGPPPGDAVPDAVPEPEPQR